MEKDTAKKKNKNTPKNKIMKLSFIIISIILIIGVIIYQHKVNLNINNQPPSKKWGKGKLLDEADITTTPAIIKDGKDYILAYNDKNKIKVLMIDEMGNKLKEKNIAINPCKINNMVIVKGKQNHYYIEYLEQLSKNSLSKSIKIDKDLNVVSREDMHDLRHLTQVGDNVILRGYNDSIEIIDTMEGNKKTIKVPNVSNLQGVKYKDKYIICYNNTEMQDVTESCIFYENKKFSEPKKLFNMIVRYGQMIPTVTITAADETMYFFVQKAGSNIVYKLPIDAKIKDIDELKYKYKDFSFPGVGLSQISCSDYYNGDTRILVEGTRIFGINKEHDDVMEYSLKGGEYNLEGAVSKSKALSTFSSICGDIAIYCDFKPKGDAAFSCPYDLYMTSTKDEFKKQNNDLKKFEKNIALGETATGAAYSLLYVLLAGAAWIFPGLTLMGIFTLSLHKFSIKRRKVIYTGILIITTALKTLCMYNSFYKRSFYYLPKELASPIVGITILIVISVFCYIYSYLFYSDFTEELPVGTYMPFLVMDTLISLLIFSPYLIV